MKKTINSPHRVISRVSNCELMSELFRNAHARWRSLGHKDPESCTGSRASGTRRVPSRKGSDAPVEQVRGKQTQEKQGF